MVSQRKIAAIGVEVVVSVTSVVFYNAQLPAFVCTVFFQRPKSTSKSHRPTRLLPQHVDCLKLIACNWN